MAPNFFSKFVKANGNRDRSSTNGSSDSVSPRASSSLIPRGRSQSTSNNTTTAKDDDSEIPTISVEGAPHNRSLDSLATHNTQLNVTVVPPSPFSGPRDLSDSEDEDNQINTPAVTPASTARTTPAPPITVISPTEEGNDETPVPTPRVENPPPRSTGPSTETSARSGSSTTLVSSPSNNSSSTTSTTMSSASLAPPILRKQTSNKSIKKVEPVVEMSINTHHARAATAPAGAAPSQPTSEFGQLVPSPIVESPTETQFPASNSGSVAPPSSAAPSSVTSPSASTTHLHREGTNVSVNSDSKKSRVWKRSNTKQPTGLASAIAASGLAMANASLSVQHQNHMSNSVTSPPPIPVAPNLSRERNATTSSVRSSSKSVPKGHNKTRSGELSPRSTRSRKSSGSAPGRRRTSIGGQSDAHSERNGNGNGYYSGLDDSSDGGTSSSAEVSDDELGEDDIPVTGFAVASNKRNADFHELFPQVPDADYLIEDYGCALLRDILMQGRLYISENHICFHSNIFGWVTDAIIPISEIIGLEKKMTAFVIPNAIQITTRQEKFLFASFLARDTAYDVIFNIWRLARPSGMMNGSARSVNGGDDNASILSSGRGSLEGGGPQSLGGTVASSGTGSGAGAKPALQARKPTQCLCGKDNQHYTEGVMDTVIPGTPDKIHGLMFGHDFLKNFLSSNQKVLDIQMGQWTPPITPGSKGSKRSLSYIKPLNGAVGPRQTKCEIEDEIMHYDPDGYLSNVTTTRTPDVPSGGVFAVKTRTCITWASSTSSRVVVTTQVDWSGRSLFKGVIGPAAIDGQRTYHAELEKAMKSYITDHKAEFLPEGAELAEGGAPAGGVSTKGAVEDVKAREAADAAAAAAAREDEERRKREAAEKEKQRKSSGIKGWAWDTFDGALGVAIKSTEGMLELLKDAWDSTSSTSMLSGLILLLVVSNVWTLMKVGKAREDAIKTLEERKFEEGERWVHSIVTALWDELAAGKRPHPGTLLGTGPLDGPTTPAGSHTVEDAEQQVPLATITVGGDGETPLGAAEPSPKSAAQMKEELVHLLKSLDAMEERVKVIREGLAQLALLDALD